MVFVVVTVSYVVIRLYNCSSFFFTELSSCFKSFRSHCSAQFHIIIHTANANARNTCIRGDSSNQITASVAREAIEQMIIIAIEMHMAVSCMGTYVGEREMMVV